MAAWLAVWLVTRGLVVAEVGFWAGGHVHLQDVSNYLSWSHTFVSDGAFPSGHSWQYPPGAGLLMIFPRVAPGAYGQIFVGLMLLLDLTGLILLARFARREGNTTGVWVWLLAMPLLGTFTVLRFDMAPTVIVIAALLVLHRRPGWFGVLAGLGAAVKIWPILVLFGEWEGRSLIKAAIAAAAAVAVVFAISAALFSGATGFLGHTGERGLQEEAVATAPWQVEQIVSGDPYPRTIGYGAWQVASGTADVVAGALRWLTLAGLVGAAFWWRLRARGIRAGRDWLAADSVGRDFVFAVVLFTVVASPVLSTQYMLWLLGLAAVVLSCDATSLRRPAWIVVGACLVSTATFRSPELTLLRDAALLGAAVDAWLALAATLREPGGRILVSV